MRVVYLQGTGNSTAVHASVEEMKAYGWHTTLCGIEAKAQVYGPATCPRCKKKLREKEG